MDFLRFDEGISKIQENQVDFPVLLFQSLFGFWKAKEQNICIEKRFCASKPLSDESGLLAYSSDMTNQKRFLLGEKNKFPGCLGLLREKLFSPSCLAVLFDFSKRKPQVLQKNSKKRFSGFSTYVDEKLTRKTKKQGSSLEIWLLIRKSPPCKTANNMSYFPILQAFITFLLHIPSCCNVQQA